MEDREPGQFSGANRDARSQRLPEIIEETLAEDFSAALERCLIRRLGLGELQESLGDIRVSLVRNRGGEGHLVLCGEVAGRLELSLGGSIQADMDQDIILIAGIPGLIVLVIVPVFPLCKALRRAMR